MPSLEGIAGLITALGGVAIGLLGAYTMYVKARSVESVQMNTLRRLWDTLELKNLIDQLPDGLRRDVRKLLGRTNNTSENTEQDQQGAPE